MNTIDAGWIDPGVTLAVFKWDYAV